MSCTKDTRGFQMPCRKSCMLLGKRANNAMSVSFSHRRTHKMQEVNLQWKRIFWPEGNCFVKLRVSTKAIKTLKSKVPPQPLQIPKQNPQRALAQCESGTWINSKRESQSESQGEGNRNNGETSRGDVRGKWLS